MNVYSSTTMLSRGWTIFKDAVHAPYLMVAPQDGSQDMRLVLIDIMTLLLTGKHIAMLAESHEPNSLRVLYSIAGENRILKRGDSTCLFAELSTMPSAEKLCALPNAGLFRLRFAGFDGAVPRELIFSGVLNHNCPADIVLDCTYVSGRPALGISFDEDALEEEQLVSLIRQAVNRHGSALRIDFAS